MPESPSSARVEEIFLRCRGMDVPLAGQLQAFTDQADHLGAQYSAAVESLIQRLVKSNAGAGAPQIGEPMPAFLLPDEQGRLVGLSDLLNEGPLAIAFDRGYWCPYCRINVAALARAEREVAPERRHIAAIVPDRQRFAAWLKSDANAPFPVLTDMDTGYAMSIGLAIYVGDAMKRMMAEQGFDPSVSQGTTHWLLPIPATFVVDTHGTVRARYIDPDYRMRMAIEDLVGALRAAK
jgi:peroxiredoxin